MMLRALALALVLSCGFLPATALAKKPYKAKTIKPRKDPRFKDSKVAKVRQPKPKKSVKPLKPAKSVKSAKH
jgi:hypothetical protein